MAEDPIEHPQLDRLYALQHEILELLNALATKVDVATGLVVELTDRPIELGQVASETLKRLRGAAGESELLSPTEVAQILGISKMTLWRIRSTGSFVTPVRISTKSIGFRRADLELWIASRKHY